MWLFLVVMLFCYFVVWFYPEGEWEVYFLDVGQGDAILIQTPDRRQILIDGGADGAVLSQLGEVMVPWDRFIDVVVLTHADFDHMGGLLEVLKRYEVGQVWDNQLPEVDKAHYEAFLEVVGSRGVRVVQPETGDLLSLGEGFDLEVYVSREVESDLNDNSIVLRLLKDDRCLFLLTGDIGAREEKDLLDSGVSAQCVVYKAGHHGSRSSTSDLLLEAMKPTMQVAVISAGRDNSYGHPHGDVLKRLEEVLVVETAVWGRVRFVVDGVGRVQFSDRVFP